MNPNLSDRVLARIEEQEVRPLPRWVFTLRAAGFWALWIVTTLIGASVVSIALFRLAFAGWAFRLATHDSTARFLVQTVPVIWFLLFVAVVVAAYVLFRHTPHGYRHPFYWIVSASLGLSLLLGAGLHAQGAGKLADEFAGKAVPFYVPLERQERRLWVNGPRGLLAGQVTAREDVMIFLKDFDGADWEVDGAALTVQELDAATPGMRVRVIGMPVKKEEHTLLACLLLPWDAPVPVPGERKIGNVRSNPCKGLRPYEALQPLR